MFQLCHQQRRLQSVILIKKNSLSLLKGTNKLERLLLASQMFTGAYHRVAHLNLLHSGRLRLYLSISDLSGANDLAYSVSMSVTKKKILLHRHTRGLYHKTYYGRNLQISVISWCVCPWQAFPA
jgi:hypothetical protein